MLTSMTPFVEMSSLQMNASRFTLSYACFALISPRPLAVKFTPSQISIDERPATSSAVIQNIFVQAFCHQVGASLFGPLSTYDQLGHDARRGNRYIDLVGIHDEPIT